MSEIKILQLSDLHFDRKSPKDTKIILNALWEDLVNFKVIDIILFTGDLVKKGDDKDSFAKAHEMFIDPLLKTTGLNKDRFFIVPGNHDIQMSQINRIIEAGLNVLLKDREAVNSILDNEMENGFQHIERLDNYNDFKNNHLENGYTEQSNKLYSTHTLNIKGKEVGIACLNSTWRATGKPNNYDLGKLLIGERQIDAGLDGLKECSIKIALLHHPLGWLTEFDKIDAEIRLYKEFDFIFCGHLHHGKVHYIKANNENEIFVISGGSLFQGRKHYNGYSVVEINSQNGKGTIFYRKYTDIRKKFVADNDRCNEGKIEITLKGRQD